MVMRSFPRVALDKVAKPVTPRVQKERATNTSYAGLLMITAAAVFTLAGVATLRATNQLPCLTNIQNHAVGTIGMRIVEKELENSQTDTEHADYPVQDDDRGRVDPSKTGEILLNEEEQEVLDEHREELEVDSIRAVQSAHMDPEFEAEVEEEQEKLGATRVAALGNLLFEDGPAYEAAPTVVLPDTPIRQDFYTKVWYLQKMHDEFFQSNPHKRYIPRLAQSITRKEFHEIFRKTSTPVIMNFEHLRNLGLLTKAWTLAELRERFPYEPSPGATPLNYDSKTGRSAQLDLGPALYELHRDTKLEKGTGSKRNFPRNLMIKPKYLALLDATFPPFIPPTRFMPPALWMGTSTADTKLHHDCCDNFVMMISGTKRWTISPPPDARQLEPVVCTGHHKSLCWAGLKYPNDPNMDEKSRAQLNSLQNVTIDLKAGEMLYLPAGWWHHIENLGPTVMVNFWARGCSNSELANTENPKRPDRPDLFRCPSVSQKTLEYINKA